MSIGDNPGSGVLSGTSPVSATEGHARFTDLSINQPGSGYTLIATGQALVSATSEPFTISSTGKTITMQSGSGQSGTINTVLSESFVVRVTDDQSQPAKGIQVDFSGHYPSGAEGVSLSNTQVSTDDNGRASTVLTFGSRIGTYTVSASVPGAVGSPINFRATATAPAYPATFSLSHTYQFPNYPDAGRYGPNDYLIVGLPGYPGISMVDLLQGVQDNDWKLFTDNGEESNYLVAYDGSAAFHALPGRGFLLLHRGSVSVNRSVPTAQLESGNAVVIPLHKSWNLITNPFDKSISWSKIQSVNGIPDPIWSHQQSFSQSGLFDPFIGYYFFNSQNLPSLRVPYDSIFSMTGINNNSVNGWTIEARIHSPIYKDGGISFGVCDGALDEFDVHDVRKPVIPGQKVNTYFSHPEWNIGYPVFASDMRAPGTGVQIWEPVIESPGDNPSEVMFSGLWRVPGHLDIRLMRDANFDSQDLRSDSAVYLKPAGAVRRLKIAVGTSEDLNSLSQNVLPEQPVLTEGYPNPATQSSRVAVMTNRDMAVRLTVHDIYGREIRTLFHGTLPAGKHVFEWAGDAGSGIPVASGLYLFRMSAEDGTQRIRRIIYTR